MVQEADSSHTLVAPQCCLKQEIMHVKCLYESVGIIDFSAQCHLIQMTIGILTPVLNANALDSVRAALISVGEKRTHSKSKKTALQEHA